MKLVDLFPPSMMLLDVDFRDKKSVIKGMLQHLVAEGKLQEDALRKAERAIQKREAQGSTGIGKGLAIPHAKACPFVNGVLGVFARSTEGIPFDSVDGGQVHILFLVLSSPESSDTHLAVMKKIAMLHRDEKTLRFLATRANQESVTEIFKEADDNFS
jgi:mannitol/fructose-specific phosphotransferase system IIA component (Ntr-type)